MKPVTPALPVGRYLDAARLRLGDIVLTGSASTVSRRIQQHTRGLFSHAAVCIGGGLLVEATPPLSREVDVGTFNARLKDAWVCVLRPRRDPFGSEAVRRQFLLEVAFHRRSLYSFTKAFSFLAPRLRGRALSDALICSELVARSYARIGLQLVPGAPPNQASPNDFVQSCVLRDVTRSCTTTAAAVVPLAPYISNRWVPLRALLWRLSWHRAAWITPPHRWRGWHYRAFLLQCMKERWVMGVRIHLGRRLVRAYRSSAESRRQAVQRPGYVAMVAATLRHLEAEVRIADVSPAIYEPYQPAWRDRMRQLDRQRLSQVHRRRRITRDLMALLSA